MGAEMGVTKERVRQLEARALSKLRLAAEEEKIRAERAKERAEIEAREAREREANEALRLGGAADEDSDESEDEDER